MKCPNCKEELIPGKMYCESCGYEVQYVPDFDPEIENSLTESIISISDDLSDIQQENKKSVSFILKEVPFLWVIIGVVGLLTCILLVYGIIGRVRSNSLDYQYKKALESAAIGEYATAISYIEKAIDLAPNNTDLILLEADYYVQYGFKDTAKAVLLDAITNQVASLKIYDTLIEMYLAEDNVTAISDLVKTCTITVICEKYAKYISNPPVFSLDEGIYYDEISIKISGKGSGSIYYTINGNIPNKQSTLYKDIIYLSEGEYTISAIYINSLGIASEVNTQTYIIDLSKPYPPELNVYSGIFTSPETIEAFPQDGKKIFYSMDGSSITEDSLLYTGPIAMPLGNTVFKCATMSDAGVFSDEIVRVIELTVSGSIPIDSAIATTINALIENGKLFDTTGKGIEVEGIYSYSTSSAFSFEGNPYYLIIEYYTSPGGKKAKTGNLFGVQMISGDFTNVAYDDYGHYRIY